MSDYPHGTPDGYRRGCFCLLCQDAWQAAHPWPVTRLSARAVLSSTRTPFAEQDPRIVADGNA